MKKFKLSIIFAVVCAIMVGCGYDYDWMSGSYGGDGKLSGGRDEYSKTPPVVIETKPGSFEFSAIGYFKMGDETPLPGCNLQVSVSGDADGKYELTDLSRAYKGQSQDLLGCLAQVNEKSARVEIYKGWIKRDKNGGTTLHLEFSRRAAPGETLPTDEPVLEYDLPASKTSWFW